MLFKRSLFLGITSGLLSGAASVIYFTIYKSYFYIDFTTFVNEYQLIGACMFGCLLAAIGHWAMLKVMPKNGEIVFNFAFTLLTFASILGPLGKSWSLDYDVDLMFAFPMFTIAMHFFPAIVWFTLRPLFFKTNR